MKQKRSKEADAKEAASTHDARLLRPPHDVFVNGVMRIAASQGFEAPGEPVHYGSHIRLMNMHAGQYLCAKETTSGTAAIGGDRDTRNGYSGKSSSSIIQLVSPEEMRSCDNTKACIFRVMPRYENLRAEGDRVMFEDLIVISHFSGRCLYRAASDRRVVMSDNPVQRTALRLYPFLHYRPYTEHALRAGMVVQFYHKVVNAFMTVDCMQRKQQRQPHHHHRGDTGGTRGLSRVSMMDMVTGSANLYEAAQHKEYRLKAVVRFSTLIDKCGGFWRLETLPLHSDTTQRRVTGIIRPGSRLRLRHVLYDKYLALKPGDRSEGNRNFQVALLDCPVQPMGSMTAAESSSASDSVLHLAEFEVHLLHNARPQQADNSADSSPAIVELGANLRLRHVVSGSYLTVGLDENESQYVFQCSGRDYDKDVYQVLPVKDAELATVATARLMKSILDELLVAMINRSHDHDTRMMRATAVLQSLVSDAAEGFLSRRCAPEDAADVSATREDSCDSFRRAQNIADELGYVLLLLQIADQACSRALLAQAQLANATAGEVPLVPQSSAMVPSLSEVENDLARTAYMVLGTLISGNRDVVESVVEAGGVQVMLRHLDIPTRGADDWTPPLLQLVDASYAGAEQPVALITEEDLTLLLDRITAQLVAGQVPSKFIYQFLARVCCPGRGSSGGASIVGGSEQPVNCKMQSMICNHILGSNPQRESPFWSLMVYRTFIDEADEKEQQPPPPLQKQQMQESMKSSYGSKKSSSIGGFGGGRRDLDRQESSSYSIYKSRSYLTPRFAELMYQNTGRSQQRRLLISTTPYGQIRPSGALMMQLLTLTCFRR